MLVSMTTENSTMCVVCHQQATLFSRTSAGIVCYNCIPYNLSREAVINQRASYFENVITSEVPSEVLIVRHGNNYCTNVIVRDATITDKNITNILLYVSSVAFEGCKFDDVSLGSIATYTSVRFHRCTGDLSVNRIASIVCDDCDMQLRSFTGILTCFDSTIILAGERLKECHLKNSHITASSQLDRVLRTNIDSTIKQPPTVNCFVCSVPIIGEITQHLAGKTVHQRCVERQPSSNGNTRTVGTKKDGYRMFSIELELNDDETDEYDDLLLDLIKMNCLRKCDGTVSDEFNTPIFNNEEEFLKFESVFTRAIPFVTESARTHIHIGVPERLKSFCYNNPMIFDELTECLQDTAEYLPDFFGCSFSTLCPASTSNFDRFRWINVCSHYQTLECRLAQLCSWPQYVTLVRFYRELIKHIHGLCVKLPEYREMEKIRDIEDLSRIQVAIREFYVGYQSREVLEHV